MLVALEKIFMKNDHLNFSWNDIVSETHFLQFCLVALRLEVVVVWWGKTQEIINIGLKIFTIMY